jgi:hypothetical protein
MAIVVTVWFAQISASDCLALLWRGDPNRTWSEVSANGRYVFAVISTLPIEQEVAELYSDRSVAEQAKVKNEIRVTRQRFPATGMYVNDGSRAAIWSPNNPPYRGIPSSDGKRLVALGEGANSATCFDLINVYEATSAYWEVRTEDVLPTVEYMVRRLCDRDWRLNFDIRISSAGDRVLITTTSDDTFDLSLPDRKLITWRTIPNTMRIVTNGWTGRFLIVVLATVVGTFAWKLGRSRLRSKGD